MEDSQNALLPESLKEDGYKYEFSRRDYVPTPEAEEEERLFEDAAHRHLYAQGFLHKPHINYVTDPQPEGDAGPMAVSIALQPEGAATELQVLIHSKEGWEPDTVAVADAEEWGGELQALRRKRRGLAGVKFTPRADDELKARLAKYEQRMISLCHKFGVLFSKEDQTDELQIYNNEHGSPAFEEFLTFLGTKVELQGFTGYNGGLDTKSNTTGTHSIYTRTGEREECEIMFHPLTYLPYSAIDPQQIERKRHIGNDVVVVVFSETSAPQFSSSSIQSQFNHVFVIVSPVLLDGECCYRVFLSRKDGIPAFGPPLPPGGIVRRDAAGRQWLLDKLINAERAAFRSPTFQKKFINVRKFQLQYLLQEGHSASLTGEWDHALLVLQHTTRFTRKQLEAMRGQLEPALNGGQGSGEEKRRTRDRMTAAEFRQVWTHLCPSWQGRENEVAVQRVFDGAKLNGTRDRGLAFFDLVRLLDVLAFGGAGQRLALLRRLLLNSTSHDGREGGDVLGTVVPADLLDDVPRLSFSEFKERAGADAALLDLVTVAVDGEQPIALLPDDFVARQPDWWIAELKAHDSRQPQPQPQFDENGYPLAPGEWCVLF